MYRVKLIRGCQGDILIKKTVVHAWVPHGAKEGNSPPADGSEERREGATKKVSPSKMETIRLRMGRLTPPRLGIEPSSPA